MKSFFTQLRKCSALFSIVAVLALCLAACSPEITKGEVVKKEFSPAHTNIVMVPITVSNGKTSTTTFVPFTYYYPDSYYITISAFVDGEKKTATFRVTKEVYEDTKMNAEFVYTKDMEPSDPEYTRERVKED